MRAEIAADFLVSQISRGERKTFKLKEKRKMSYSRTSGIKIKNANRKKLMKYEGFFSEFENLRLTYSNGTSDSARTLQRSTPVVNSP